MFAAKSRSRHSSPHPGLALVEQVNRVHELGILFVVKLLIESWRRGTSFFVSQSEFWVVFFHVCFFFPPSTVMVQISKWELYMKFILCTVVV